MSLIDDLKKQLKALRSRQDSLSPESDNKTFPVWVLSALASADEERAAKGLTDDPNDGGIDAIVITEHAVWVVQAKFRLHAGVAKESLDKIHEVTDVYPHLLGLSTDDELAAFEKTLAKNPRDALGKFREATNALRDGKRQLNLVFATTGKVLASVREKAQRIVKKHRRHVRLTVLDAGEIQRLLLAYIRDVAPQVPELELFVQGGKPKPAVSLQSMTAFHVAVKARQVFDLHRKGGEQIFARNIRFGLGDQVHANEAIRKTLLKNPERFWFLNNGLTIACDQASVKGNRLKLRDAQVINGQQTTRTISSALHKVGASHPANDALVAVRVISFATASVEESDKLIAEVVEATNLQNATSKADLRANDIAQIDLARALAGRGYLYLRKRGAGEDLKRHRHLSHRIKREKLFSAVAGAIFDSVALRKGQTPLFDPDDKYYRSILSRNVDFMLLAWHVWNIVSTASRGSDARQASKYLVHFHVMRELTAALHGKFRNAERALYQRNAAIKTSIGNLAAPFFSAARFCYLKHRGDWGRALLPKKYFQRPESSDHFGTLLRSPESKQLRNRIRSRSAMVFEAVTEALAESG